MARRLTQFNFTQYESVHPAISDCVHVLSALLSINVPESDWSQKMQCSMWNNQAIIQCHSPAIMSTCSNTRKFWSIDREWLQNINTSPEIGRSHWVMLSTCMPLTTVTTQFQLPTSMTVYGQEIHPKEPLIPWKQLWYQTYVKRSTVIFCWLRITCHSKYSINGSFGKDLGNVHDLNSVSNWQHLIDCLEQKNFIYVFPLVDFQTCMTTLSTPNLLWKHPPNDLQGRQNLPSY